MLELKVCPVCSSKLELVNGAYICTNDKCNILVLDNHILTLNEITRLFDDTEEQEENTGEVDMNTNNKIWLDESGAYTQLQVMVMNQTSAEEYSMQPHSCKSVVISITSRCSYEAFIVPNKVSNIIDVLKIQFNDEDTEDENFGGITYTEAKQISDFVKKYKDNKEIGLIIVQCEAGQSRSAGVAGAILKYLYDDDTRIFNDGRYTPNMLCYRKVLTALMYEE